MEFDFPTLLETDTCSESAWKPNKHVYRANSKCITEYLSINEKNSKALSLQKLYQV